MNDKGNLFLGILWLVFAPLMLLAENHVLAAVWFCTGIFELIIAWKRKGKKTK